MATEWFYKTGDFECGPLNQAQLIQMVIQRRVGRETPVRKGTTGPWILAGLVRGLKFPSDFKEIPSTSTEGEASHVQHTSRLLPTPEYSPWILDDATAPSKPKSSSRDSSATTQSQSLNVNKGAGWGTVAAIVSFSIMFMLRFFGGGKPAPVQNAGPGRQLPAAAQNYAAARTMNYWNQMRSAVATAIRELQSGDASRAINGFTQSSSTLRSLPTSGVDPDAVACGLMVATTFDQVAYSLRRSNSPDFLFNDFARAFNGDVLGPMSEASGAKSEAERQWQVMVNEAARVRAVLTNRYGIEFPPP